jgi:hypothetical protein
MESGHMQMSIPPIAAIQNIYWQNPSYYLMPHWVLLAFPPSRLIFGESSDLPVWALAGGSYVRPIRLEALFVLSTVE